MGCEGFSVSDFQYHYCDHRNDRCASLPERQAELRRDYQAMRDMYLSEPKPFEEVLATLAELEARLNQSADY